MKTKRMKLELSDNPYPFEPGVIYKLTAPNGKAYVGQSIEYENRMKKHGNASSGCRKLNASIKKYGFDNFKREILADDLQPGLELDSAEIYYISYHNTFQSPNGLNLTAGGEGGKKSEETKQRMRKPKTSAAKVNMSAAAFEAQNRPGVKAKQSVSKMGDKNPQKRLDVRAKNAAAKMGDKNPNKRHEVKVLISLTTQIHRYEKILETTTNER